MDATESVEVNSLPADEKPAKPSRTKSADRLAGRVRLASSVSYPITLVRTDGQQFILDPKGRAEIDAALINLATLPSGVLFKQII